MNIFDKIMRELDCPDHHARRVKNVIEDYLDIDTLSTCELKQAIYDADIELLEEVE
jgi:hypothetical protein